MIETRFREREICHRPGFPVAHYSLGGGGRHGRFDVEGFAGWPGRNQVQAHAVIAGNGILLLIPSALFLASKASAGEFDTSFYLVQALELVSGGVNITLLGLNMRDGLKLKG